MSGPKRALIEAMISILKKEFDAILESAKAAHHAATHEESKAEDQHDTRGLEASYLAGAQMARAENLKRIISSYQFVEIRDFSPGDAIAVGALIELNISGRRTWYFLVNQGSGGMTLSHGGKTIQIITTQSPLGEDLIGRTAGDSFEMSTQGGSREYEIISVA